jgi:hypothetical protein
MFVHPARQGSRHPRRFIWLSRRGGLARKSIFHGHEMHMHRFQDHLGGVFPALRAQVRAHERVAREAAHAAVNVGKFAAEHHVEDECRQRSAEIPVQARHGARRDLSLEARAHDEFGAG